MNYEEKYNEILEWARKNKARLNGVPIEEVLPELAESEDEMIMSRIIDGFKNFSRSASKWNNIPVEEVIAYLEKQKEQKPAESISQPTIQGKGVYKICPRCKERMVRDDSMVYTSMPPQYRYECPKCGERECDIVMYDNPEMKEQKPADLSEMMVHKEPYIAPVPTPMVADEQKPAEWSEEDEDMLNRCISSIEEAKDNRYYYEETDGDTSYDKEIAWLKSTHLQPHWKPSKEQMKALLNAEGFLRAGLQHDSAKTIAELYEQLKKL